MEILKLNETPIRTSRNFNINNINLKNVSIPQVIGNFNNVTIFNKDTKTNIDNHISKCPLLYGVGESDISSK